MIKKPEKKKVGVSRGAKIIEQEDMQRDRRFFDAMVEGYAYCRMIHEKGGAPDWVYITVNDSFEKLTGWKGVVGKQATEVMPDIRETQPELFETCSRVALTGRPEKLEMFVEALQKWFSVSVFSPAKGCFAALFHEITERKETEARLRESTEYFRTVANFTYDWEYWLDNNRRILYTSPSCERITGYSAAKFEQDSSLLEKIIHHDDRSLYVRHMREEFQKTEPASLDFRIVTAGGEVRWINHACQRVHDMDGRPMGRRASNRDVTQRRQMEQALRENESILTMSEEVAQTGSWRWDLRTKKAAWSDQMFRLFEVNREDFDGDMNRVITERVHPDDAQAVLEFNRSILTGISSIASLTYRIVLPNGIERTLRTHGKLVRDETGHPISMTGYVQEVTEWVRVKNQLFQMKRLYAILSEVNQAIFRVKDLAELYQSICDVVVKHGELAAAWIELLDETLGELRPVSAAGLDVKKWPLPIVNINGDLRRNGVILEALRTSRVATSEDIQTDERTKGLHKHLGKFEFHSLASIPFQLHGKTIGVLNLLSGEVGWFRDEEEIRLLDEMGRDISFALDALENEKVKRQWEQALREGEEKMRSIFRAAPTGIGVVKDRVLLDVNLRICEMTGYAKEELIGQSARVLYPTQEDFDFVGQEKYRQIAQKGTGQVETRWRKKDGSIIDVLLASTPIDFTDLSKGVTFTALDITERKQAEEALRESEDKFKYVFDNSVVAKSITEPTGEIHANRAFCEMLGYSEQEFQDRDLREITHPDDIELSLRELGSILSGEKESTRFIKRYVHRNGSVIWADVSTSLRRDANGKPLYFMTTVLDITERKRAEEELRKLSRQDQEALRIARMGHWEFDLETGQFLFNDQYYALHGTTAEVAGGYSMSAEEFAQKYVHPDDAYTVAEAIRRGVETTDPDFQYQMEGRILRADGEPRNVNVWFRIEKDSQGRTVKLYGVNQDITERKLAEAQRQNFYDTLNASLNEIYIFNAETLHFEFVSDGALRNLGYSLDEMLGMTPLDLKPSFTAASFDDLIAPLRRHKVPVISFETLHRRADGSSYPVEINLQLFDQTEPHVFLAVVLDITERKQAEEIIRRSERQMSALVTSLDDIVFEFDENGTYLNIWTADENLLAQPKSQMVGRQVFEVMGREQGASFYDAIKRVSAEGTPKSIEYPLDVIGGQRWFMARVSPILAPDGSHRTVSVLVRDITVRKQVEEQVQVQLRRVRALNEIDRAISSGLDMRLSLDILLDQTLSQLRVDAACVLLLDLSSQTLEYAIGKGFRLTSIRKSRVLLGQEFAGQAGLERRMIHIADLNTTGSQFLRRDLLKGEEFVEYFGVPLIAKGMLKGVLEIFHRSHLDPDLEWMNYLETLGGQAAIAIDNAQLFERMQRSNIELVAAYDATIEGWSHAMDLRDKETEGHTQRVTKWTEELAKRMGISQQEIIHMRRGALLHDIGKLGVPDHVLNKPDKLDEAEWAIMRQHPNHAFDMLMSIHYLRPSLDIPYCHHEKWDGSGYPRRLKGEEIPVAARIFAVVDVWDAMRSDRPYRASWPADKVRELIIEQSAKHFDPQVVDAFLNLMEESPDLF